MTDQETAWDEYCLSERVRFVDLRRETFDAGFDAGWAARGVRVPDERKD
jgi:hypothetical protein